MKILTRLYAYKGTKHAIVKGDDGIIRAINYKYLDENMVLTQELNGITMLCDHNRNTLPEMIERINEWVDWHEYIEINKVDTNNTIAFLNAYQQFLAERTA